MVKKKFKGLRKLLINYLNITGSPATTELLKLVSYDDIPKYNTYIYYV